MAVCYRLLHFDCLGSVIIDSARFQLSYSTVKMPAHIISYIARNEPISAVIRGCHSANDKAQNMICLRNTISAEAMSLMVHLLSVLPQVAVLSQILFCALSFGTLNGIRRFHRLVSAMCRVQVDSKYF